MINVNKDKEYKYFSVVLKVDVEHLGCSYSNNQNPTENDLADVEEMLSSELCWCVQSGITVSSIEEMEEE